MLQRGTQSLKNEEWPQFPEEINGYLLESPAVPQGRGKKKGKQRRRFNSSLGEHRQSKKVLTPPMMQIEDLAMTSWPHDGLPECIWIAAVSKETGRRAGAHGPLNVLESFVPREEAAVLDGRISRFELVPPERRAEARAALREQAPHGLPDGLGHALAQYPDCPALWLYDDWLVENSCDAAKGVRYMSDLVGPMIPSRDSHSAELRCMVIARIAKAGKLHFGPEVDTVELLHKYPTYLNEDDRAKVESFVRATWNSIQSMTESAEVERSEWCSYFWRRSYDISPCLPFDGGADHANLDEVDDESELPEKDKSGVIKQETSIADLRKAFAGAIRGLGAELRQKQSDATLDTFSPEEHEVKLGLASRAFRLLQRFLLTPQLWTNEMAPHLIRSLVDERIVVAWLLKKNDPALFRAYKDYGAGKRKLYKLKLEELMDSEGQDGDERSNIRELHRRLELEVNQDTMEEFLAIDLGGSFSGKNIRQMARETDLADLYSLSYQPMSTESHGEWGSLIMFDLDHCGNPLHLYHRLGAFHVDEPSYLHAGWAHSALNLAEEIIAEVFSSLGLDAESAFDRFHESVNTALEQPREASSNASDEPI